MSEEVNPLTIAFLSLLAVGVVGLLGIIAWGLIKRDRRKKK